MEVSGILVQPARSRAIKQPSTAREIRDDVCLLITGRVLYTNEEASIIGTGQINLGNSYLICPVPFNHVPFNHS